jgi:hypothetical protein
LSEGNDEVLDKLLAAGPERLRKVLDSLGDEEAQGLLRELCGRSGRFWLQFVNTRDEADANDSVKPFPTHLEYVRALWELFEHKPTLVIAKSRQMLVSWCLAAFCVWTARFHAHKGVYWQSQQWRDAVAMVCMPSGGFQGRCQFIEANLPAWLRQPVKESEGRIQYPNGSLIEALSGGPDQVRGKTISLYVGDEFAYQQDQDGVYTAVSPLIQKGAKAFFVSTPNGSGNQFATLFHGRPVGQEA